MAWRVWSGCGCCSRRACGCDRCAGVSVRGAAGIDGRGSRVASVRSPGLLVRLGWGVKTGAGTGVGTGAIVGSAVLGTVVAGGSFRRGASGASLVGPWPSLGGGCCRTPWGADRVSDALSCAPAAAGVISTMDRANANEPHHSVPPEYRLARPVILACFLCSSGHSVSCHPATPPAPLISDECTAGDDISRAPH